MVDRWEAIGQTGGWFVLAFVAIAFLGATFVLVASKGRVSKIIFRVKGLVTLEIHGTDVNMTENAALDGSTDDDSGSSELR